MIYSFDSIDQLESYLLGANKGITTKYKGVSDLVFSAPNHSNKVIRVSTYSTTSGIYIGDSWTSGTTLVNSVKMVNGNNSIGVGSNVIITPNVLAILYVNNSATTFKMSVIFGKLSNSNNFIAIPSSSSNTNTDTTLPKNTTQGADANLVVYKAIPFQTSDGFYYEQDVKIATNSVLDSSESVPGLKWLTKSGNVNSMVNTYGNDVGLYIPYINGIFYGGELLIKNGAI